MKHRWLGALSFGLLLVGSFVGINLLNTPKAEAACAPGNFTITFLSRAHISVQGTGQCSTSGGNADATKATGVYYDGNINDGDHKYYQGGKDKRAGITGKCQSILDVSNFIPGKATFTINLPRPSSTNPASECVSAGKVTVPITNNAQSGAAPALLRTRFTEDKDFKQVTNNAFTSDITYFQADANTLIAVDNDSVYDNDTSEAYVFAAKESPPPAGEEAGSINYVQKAKYAGNLTCFAFITANAGATVGHFYFQLSVGGNGGNCDTSDKFTTGKDAHNVLLTASRPDAGVPGAADVNNPGATVNDLCPIDTWGLRWVACPILIATQSSVQAMDKLTAALLVVDAGEIFNRKSAQGQAYYSAWNTFRVLALAILFLVGLVIVAARASNVELFSAITERKTLSRGGISIVILVLLWPTLHYVVLFFDNATNWTGAAIAYPFNALGDLAEGSGGSLFTGQILIGALAYGILGIPGLFALAGTMLLGLITVIVILLARKMIILLGIIISPVVIVANILPNTQKIASFASNSFIAALAVGPAISATLGAGIAMAHIIKASGIKVGNVDVGSIVAVIVIVISELVLIIVVRKVGGTLATITGSIQRGTGGLNGMFTNMRRGAIAQRGQRFQEGSLIRKNRVNSPIANAVNRAGLMIGAGKAGAGLSVIDPRRSVRTAATGTYLSQLKENALKRNPLLQQLQNDDEANAVLALSGGTVAGARQAAKDLFGDGADTEDQRNRAVAAAQAVGIDRANASAALGTVAKNKARAVGAGDVRTVSRGIRRLTGGNESAYQGIANGFAFDARSSGRADLGGTDWIDQNDSNKVWRDARAATTHIADPQAREQQQWQMVSDATMVDGISRTGVHALMTGHGNQAERYTELLAQRLNDANSTNDVRLNAALGLIDVQKALPQANGDTRDRVNRILFGQPRPDAPAGEDRNLNALQFSPDHAVEDQLSATLRAHGVNVGSNALLTMGRTYERPPLTAERDVQQQQQP